ncbi:MAG: type II toxin-antitoxin system RelE/ParE family toxin [Pirellulales bacterium]|nr:type II toxin-antitoxin system RelE/ParE family toxin [Pirellulales bacterium]
MPVFVLSRLAETDIESILMWTQERFGEAGRLRYEALLIRAILDVAENPHRAGCQNRPEITADARTYHLWHSRNRVEISTGRVRHPRHFLLYRTRDDGQVEIARVLHDSMDLVRNLPEDYQSGTVSETET